MSNTDSLEIVATLGPASWHLAPALCDAGATKLRINASHIEPEEILLKIDAVRQNLPKCPVVIDLQGAKMRLGRFSSKRVRAGETFRFSLDGNEGSCPIPHKEIFRSVEPGDTLSCDDDRIRFRVEEVDSDNIVGRAISEGILLPRKGVNLVEHPVVMDDISGPDLACIQAAVSSGCTAFAVSFIKDGKEAEWVRKRVPDAAVTGKIERKEASDHVQAIACEFDSIWICRGDLGAQLGQAPMARWISSFKPSLLNCPVLMAGQVLEHVTRNPEPTRSEVCHLFDLVNRGYSGFVLSDETAIGDDPVRAVQTLRALLLAF